VRVGMTRTMRAGRRYLKERPRTRTSPCANAGRRRRNPFDDNEVQPRALLVP